MSETTLTDRELQGYWRNGYVLKRGLIDAATVDVLRERMTPRTQRWVDFYGLLLFQLPLVGLVLWSALPLVADSFATGEKSSSAGGLPYRWLLKAFLPLAFVGLGIATSTRLRRTFRALFPENEA